jgi:hypothetical protein
VGALEESHAPYSATYVKLCVPTFRGEQSQFTFDVDAAPKSRKLKRYNGLRTELIAAAIPQVAVIAAFHGPFGKSKKELVVASDPP